MNENKQDIKKNMLELAEAMLSTLNQIDVCGEKNLDGLSGCIKCIRQMKVMLEGVEIVLPEAEKNKGEGGLALG